MLGPHDQRVSKVQLIKVTYELKYAKNMNLLAEHENIHRDLLSEEAPDTSRWLMPGLRLEDKSKKRIMLVDPVRGVIDIDIPPNIGFCKDSVLQFLKSVHNRFGIPEIARWGLRSIWIQDYRGKFEDLMGIYKQHLLGNSTLIRDAYDVGTVLDYHINGEKVSVTTGPMESDQLKRQFLTFDAESVPAIFAFVSVDIGDTKTKDYSLKHVTEFFSKAMDEGERMARDVFHQLGVGG